MVRPRLAPTLLLPLALILTVSACESGTPVDSDSAGDPALLERIDGYRGWARAPDPYQTPLAISQGTHGGFVDIYVNDVVAAALLAEEDTLGQWPLGSIIVKDGWDDAEGTSLRQIAIMERRDDGWYWEEYDAGDLVNPVFAGRPDVCVDCHAAGSDSVRAFNLP